MKDFLKKNKIALAIVIYFGIVGSFFYFLILPIQNKIVGKASDIQQEKIDQDITKKKIMTVPVMEKDYQRYKENEGNLDVIINQAQDVEFIKELERMAEETNNKIEFKIQEIKATDKTKKPTTDIKGKLVYTSFLSMQVALEGDYSSLLNFIHKVENYKNYVNIMSIRSEKISLDTGAVVSANPFVAVSEVKKINTKEVLNSILDIVVYIKK
ncbi:MAG: hypothetical protein WC823_01680 [Parcubacteria group bacterium]|jgi:hypothetical protein